MIENLEGLRESPRRKSRLLLRTWLRMSVLLRLLDQLVEVFAGMTGAIVGHAKKAARSGHKRRIAATDRRLRHRHAQRLGLNSKQRPDTKAETLAALREVFDGEWTRDVGTDGGKRLHWKGKVGLIFGATGVIDMHYSVIGAMGDRFVLNRLAPEESQFGRALTHVGPAAKRMRRELAEAVAHLFAGRRADPQPISNEEVKRIDRVISLVVRLRGAVERDRYSREIEAVYGAEGTARIGLMLERLLAGLDVLGVERQQALTVVEAVAMDSVPPTRRAAYEIVHKHRAVETADVAIGLGLPTITVRRALEDLAAYHLVERHRRGQGKSDRWIAI